MHDKEPQCKLQGGPDGEVDKENGIEKFHFHREEINRRDEKLVRKEEELARKSACIERLEEMVRLLCHMFFGRKSEAAEKNKDQLLPGILNKAEATDKEEQVCPEGVEKEARACRGDRDHGGAL